MKNEQCGNKCLVEKIVYNSDGSLGSLIDVLDDASVCCHLKTKYGPCNFVVVSPQIVDVLKTGEETGHYHSDVETNGEELGCLIGVDVKRVGVLLQKWTVYVSDIDGYIMVGLRAPMSCPVTVKDRHKEGDKDPDGFVGRLQDAYVRTKAISTQFD